MWTDDLTFIVAATCRDDPLENHVDEKQFFQKLKQFQITC